MQCSFAHHAFGDDFGRHTFDDRYPVGVLLEQSQVEVNVNEDDLIVAEHGPRRCDRTVTERTIPSRIHDHFHGVIVPSAHYLERVRPVTSIAVAVLLALIVVAFVVKLAAGGLTP